MKQIKFLAAICCVITLCSCGNSSKSSLEESKSVKDADGKEYADYHEACRVGDFESAHTLLNKMESELNDFYENNEMVVTKKGIFSNDYDNTNLNKFEKLCQNQIDAILYVYGEEIKYILGMDDFKDPDKKAKILLSEAENDGKRIVNKVNQEHPTTGWTMERNFNESMESLNKLVESITGNAVEKESEE